MVQRTTGGLTFTSSYVCWQDALVPFHRAAHTWQLASHTLLLSQPCAMDERHRKTENSRCTSTICVCVCVCVCVFDHTDQPWYNVESVSLRRLDHQQLAATPGEIQFLSPEKCPRLGLSWN